MLRIFNYLGDVFNGPTGEESASQGYGLKIITPNQMLSRLPISLAQLKEGNNSEKLKNEIRQILYSLYRLKKLTKFDQRYLKMKTIFMNTKNSKTSKPHRFKLGLTDKLSLKNPNKNMTLANLSIYYRWKNIKPEHNNNKFQISAPTWNDTFVLPDGSYSIVDIQDYFEFIIKKYEILTKNPPVQIYPNKIKNRIVFKIKTGYKLGFLTTETMILLASRKKDVDKEKDGEIVPKLESVEVVLVHCNLVKNDYQNTSKVLFSFVPNKQFGQLINLLPHSLTMMNIVSAEFSFVEVWFTDQASKSLEIEDNVNLTVIIG